MRYILAILAVVVLLTGCGSNGSSTPTSASVVAKLKTAGLEVGTTTHMQPSDYGLAPYVADGTIFAIPSVGPDIHGRLFTGNAHDLAALKAYYDNLGKATALFHSWTYRHGPMFLQVGGDVPQAKADAYGAALARMK